MFEDDLKRLERRRLEELQNREALERTLLANLKEELNGLNIDSEEYREPTYAEMRERIEAYLIKDDLDSISREELQAILSKQLPRSRKLRRWYINGRAIIIETMKSHFGNYFGNSDLIERGGFGEVYKAKSRQDGLDYAVKKIRVRRGENEIHVVREMRILSKLRHVNIIRYHNSWIEVDFDDEKRQDDKHSDHLPVTDPANELMVIRKVVFIQMDLADTSLDNFLLERIMQSDTVNESECVSLFFQMMNGLQHIHGLERAIIHRDIKPANVLLNMNGNAPPVVKLSDFGLSCRHGMKALGRDFDNSEMPGKHTDYIGTPGYAAPEQLESGLYGTKADLYPAGLILFELFHIMSNESEKCDNMTNLVDEDERELPEELTEKWPHIADLILRLTSSDPEDRPTASEVLDYLQLYYDFDEETMEVRLLNTTTEQSDDEGSHDEDDDGQEDEDSSDDATEKKRARFAEQD